MEKINNSLQNKIRRIATYILLHICIVPSKPLSIVKFLTLNVNFFLLNKQEPQILTSCFNTAFDIYLIALWIFFCRMVIWLHILFVAFDLQLYSLHKSDTLFIIIVSATRRSRDIKIPLCLSDPVRKSLI